MQEAGALARRDRGRGPQRGEAFRTNDCSLRTKANVLREGMQRSVAAALAERGIGYSGGHLQASSATRA
jgi:hypothetical protein